MLLTKRITAGRPLIIGQAADLQSGVDPLSLVIGYGNALVGASAYDPGSGLVVFGIPETAPAFKAGKTSVIMEASDYQETKNINTPGDEIMPNTAFLQKKLTVVDGPTITWVDTVRQPVRRGDGVPGRRCRLDEEGTQRNVHRRRQATRRRQVWAGRHLLRCLEDDEG